ncbi:VWA domain-containing protein [Methanosarcina sp. MSH10X1]|uniref:vWA domain-containing protein n=1 Tax=Methanosarcina sp. MSH10X1 TaxID=2507075 RepID=UPI000FFC5948|nr:vWA domain-containing protein [Methanosarcina sp. MSH10X1]RXA20126.1 VWA domain-containing protein [Methanosarcina sp. MSH10X1]
MNLSLEHPEMLFLVIPVIVVGFYLLRKTKTKLVEWRMLVAFLLVIALASPYTTVTQTISEEDPSLVLVQDQTSSMGIFTEEAGGDLYKALVASTPTALVQLTGDKTSLGDTVTQYAGSGNQIVLVSDGNNNAGRDLPEALEFAKETDTPVYLVEPELTTNDLSVEMVGDKTVVVDNQNEFGIVVRQASNQSASYFLEVFVDGQLAQSRDFTLEGRNNSEKPLPINQAFTTLGAHNLRVKITPQGEDRNEVNNEFFKSVYVIPKPKLTLVTNEPDSPLGRVLDRLYNVSIVSTYPGAAALESSKVLVLDNQLMSSFSETQIKEIKNYVSNGGGLVVVGGEQAYNYGNYLNSSLEEILPVLSKPSEYKGGRNLVLILDVSPSTAAHQTQADILANAIYIIQNENLRDANAGVIAFGSKGYDVSGGFVFLGLSQNREILEDKISRLTPDEQSKTSLNEGLNTAKAMLAGSDGELDAIIISDGAIEDSYEPSLQAARELQELGVNLYFIHVQSVAPSQADKTRNYYAENLMGELGLENSYFHINKGERANIGFEPPAEPPEEGEEEEVVELDAYPLLEYSPDHFITKNVNLSNASITGYNDVTPKAGAERLVITVTGKPVLTTWRFGLGRVAAFTTDNGEGEGSRWSSALYGNSTARLISGTTNWAIGNPRAEEGAAVDSPDTWLGTPSDLTLTMYDEGIPEVKLDGSPLDLALTGRNTYEASINPDSIGVHDISGYPLAVNYQLEYRDVGLNEDIESLILATGGKIYTEKDARALLLKDARQNSERQSDEPVSLKMPVLLAALMLYLGEILARRIKEMRKLKNAQIEVES